MNSSADLPIGARLLDWFDREKRQLPWRGSRDPYRIWVSEIMLQQTTVEAVRRRYEVFMRRFPDLATLARASEDSVLAAWSGLGYYARARNLRRAAWEILRHHSGRFPRDPATLRRLPGFGQYTAAAVAAIAFGAVAPAADANVTRVVSRLFAIPGFADERRHRQAVLDRVERLLPCGRPGDLTAALMDLGQGICTARRPDCLRCPLGSLCRARRTGDPQRFPRRRSRPKPVRLRLVAAVIERRGRALLVRRRGTYLDGLWEFPSCPAAADPRAAAARLTTSLAGSGLLLEPGPIATVRHTIVNRRLRVQVFRGKGTETSPIYAGPEKRWFSPTQLARAAIPTLTRKIARAAGFLQT